MSQRLYLRADSDAAWNEIETEDEIALTFQMDDYSKPEAVKNAFSKTITVNGTERNLVFFKSLLPLSATVTSSASRAVTSSASRAVTSSASRAVTSSASRAVTSSASRAVTSSASRAVTSSASRAVNDLDPCRKIDAMITVDGSLFDSGYITVDEIGRKNGTLTFSVTYYSKAGQFLYNLATKTVNDESTDKLLADLYWKLPASDGSRILSEQEEKKSLTLFTLNSSFIYDNWNIMNGVGANWSSYAGRAEYERGLSYVEEFNCNFAVVPMLNGKYSTASASKSLWYCPNKQQMDKFNVPFGYVSTSKGWIQAEMPRDMNEWEMNNLVASEQRIGVRLSKFLDVISYPENNGNMAVDFSGCRADDYIRSVMDYSFIVMPKIESSDDAALFEGDYEGVNSDTIQTGYNRYETEIECTADVSNWNSINLNLDLYLKLDVQTTHKDPLNIWMTKPGGGVDGMNYNSLSFSFFLITVTYYHTVLGKTEKCYAATTCRDGEGSAVTLAASKFKSYLSGKTARTEYENRLMKAMDNIIVFTPAYRPGEEQNVYKQGFYYTKWQNESPISVSVTGIDKMYKAVTLSCETQRAFWPDARTNLPMYTQPGCKTAQFVARYQESGADRIEWGYIDYNNSTVQAVYDSENDYNSEFYNNTMTNIETSLVKKQTLFPEDVTAADLLLQFVKTMNLRLYYDVNEDAVKITTRERFYTEETTDLTDMIDLSQDIKIKHNFYDFSVLKYEFEQSDTYPDYLYQKATGRAGDTAYMYQTRLVTGNTVNEGVSDYMDNNVISTCTDYNLSSNYFSSADEAPMLKGASCKISYMAAAVSGDYDTEETEKQWNLQKKYTDPVPKICMMDKDESNIDGMCWVFHAGKANLLYKLQVSDALPVMNQISDGLCFCRFCDHVWAEGRVTGLTRLNPDETGILGYNIGTIPLFSVYHYMSDGKMPVWTETVSDGKRKLTVTENASLPKWSLTWSTPEFTFSNMDVPKENIYSMRFANANSDMYRHDTFTLTASVRMTGNENVTEMMKKLYWYDNALFRLNKVTDFAAGKPGLYKWELVRAHK